MDRYVLVTKRKASSRTPTKEPKAKTQKSINNDRNNRFSILGSNNETDEMIQPVRSQKPPPLYLREETTNNL